MHAYLPIVPKWRRPSGVRLDRDELAFSVRNETAGLDVEQPFEPLGTSLKLAGDLEDGMLRLVTIGKRQA